MVPSKRWFGPKHMGGMSDFGMNYSGEYGDAERKSGKTAMEFAHEVRAYI